MNITNVEFKARTNRVSELEEKLQTLNPRFVGEDHQIDTYFNVATGRLKLREGNIENSLIYYERANTATAKQSDILLYRHSPDPALKAILTTTHGIKVVVDKLRRIYFIDHIKFHLDRVGELGTFVEVEAIDETGSKSIESLQSECDHYAQFFELAEADFVKESYSDLLLARQPS